MNLGVTDVQMVPWHDEVTQEVNIDREDQWLSTSIFRNE